MHYKRGGGIVPALGKSCKSMYQVERGEVQLLTIIPGQGQTRLAVRCLICRQI